MNTAKRHEIFSRFRSANPSPTTELNYGSNFELLVAVVLSAQATDKSVNLATKKLFAKAPEPQDMVNLGLPKVKELIKTIGLYNNKAKNLIALSQVLLDEHNGQVPDTLEQLTALPGVGRKTANVILNTAFGKPTIAVDTHIFRVSNRTRLASGKNVVQVEEKLTKIVPKEFVCDAHHWLILHGRYTCTARKPLCNKCIICDLCEYPERTCTSLSELSTFQKQDERRP